MVKSGMASFSHGIVNRNDWRVPGRSSQNVAEAITWYLITHHPKKINQFTVQA
jgi:hypothetical protein